MQALEGASGAEPTQFGGVLESDVVTMVRVTVDGRQVQQPSIFDDGGRVKMALALKDVTSPTGPTTNNLVTFNRYRVVYKRADGRNSPGVDVPYPFDSAVTFTVTPQGVEAGFTLVRVQAKLEAPLIQLVDDGMAIAISTIADVTFYGQDQTGREVIATGSIGVNFANWGDPQ